MNSYFSHDSNARNDVKLIQVRMSKLGAAGYGIYWMIIERLREEQDYMSIKDYNAIAFDLRVDASDVKSVIEDFGLFVFTDDGKYFYSKSLNNRMAMKDEKSKKLSEAGKLGAQKRWLSYGEDLEKNGHPIATPYKNDGNKSKVKESKVNKSKKNVVGKPDPLPYSEIIDYLNQKAGTRYKAGPEKTQKLIKALWNDGFRVPDFQKAIDNKVAEWLNDATMSKYLRPETLFGTKFESYLNQLVNKEANSHVHKSLGW